MKTQRDYDKNEGYMSVDDNVDLFQELIDKNALKIIEARRKLTDKQTKKLEARMQEKSFKNAIKEMANLPYDATKFPNLTVGQRAAAQVLSRLIETGNAKDYAAVAKVAGDMEDNVNVSVTNLEELLNKVKGDEY